MQGFHQLPEIEPLALKMRRDRLPGALKCLGTFPYGEGDAGEVSSLLCVLVGLVAAKTRKAADEMVVYQTPCFKGGDRRLWHSKLIDEYLPHKELFGL